MYSEDSIEEKELKFDGWETQFLVISARQANGRLFLDARKWAHGAKGNFAMRKGLMLDIPQWKAVIKELDAMIAKNEAVGGSAHS